MSLGNDNKVGSITGPEDTKLRVPTARTSSGISDRFLKK